MSEQIRVGIAGVTGYAGIELARLLAGHPHVRITYLAGRSRVGEDIAVGAPSLRGVVSGTVEALDVDALAAACDLVFLALPHGASMDVVGGLSERGLDIVDLSADFRFSDLALYGEWYGEHRAPDLVGKAAYGLPELFREGLPGATFVAVPGCYPTAAALSLAPLVREGWVDASDLIVDAKSGASGAGRSAALGLLLAEAGESIRAYKVPGHRHTPEIEMVLGRIGAGAPRVVFTPHLVPMARGILSTAYARPVTPRSIDELQALYERFFADEPFVRVLPPGALPETAHVRGSNYVDVAVRVDERAGGRIIVLAAIDNLGKGAAGQAVQAMNASRGWPETTGLTIPPAFP